MKCDSGSMSNRLSRLVETIIGSFPVQNSHPEQRQEGWIINLCTVHHSEPFSPLDHVGPQSIIKEEVREDVIPPTVVCRRCILPILDNSMEGILGNLEDPSVFLQTRNEEGAYLIGHRVMSPPGQWGMNPLVETLDFPKEPTCGQLNDGLPNLLAKDQRTDDWMLHVGHSKNSGCLRWVKAS